jgi:hypothetical protein
LRRVCLGLLSPGDDFYVEKPEEQLDAFLKTCSIRQLRLFREIAEGQEVERLGPIH